MGSGVPLAVGVLEEVEGYRVVVVGWKVDVGVGSGVGVVELGAGEGMVVGSGKGLGVETELEKSDVMMILSEDDSARTKVMARSMDTGISCIVGPCSQNVSTAD